MDNIDIVENLAKIYKEDFWDKLKSHDKENIELISYYSREVIDKLYPILYTEEFNITPLTATDSVCANPSKEKTRVELIDSALKFGVEGIRNAPIKSVDQLGSFKPFTIKELDVQVFDEQVTKKVDSRYTALKPRF
jgi:hypothetical protein